MSDRIGRFRPVVVGSILYGVTLIAVGLAPTYVAAAGLLVVVGLCGAVVSPTTMALVTDVVPRRSAVPRWVGSTSSGVSGC
ncbi:MFS transporter [Haloarculaceae archaeon H-GB2-1]|nr:MFS transporter [Haloarculaceae archaeon H-GB2-1]